MDFVEQLNQWGQEKKPFVFLIDFEQKKPLAWLVDDCADSFQFKFTKTNSVKKELKCATTIDELIKQPITISDYQHKYNQVMDALKKGDSFLMNFFIIKSRA